jgi:hypothetical protein
MHIVSDKSLERPGYVYNNGVGYPIDMTHEMVWDHIDGPLMYLSNGQLHWLTLRERLALWLGLTTEQAINDKHIRLGTTI